MKKNSTEIEIPFGAKDSELYQFTYTIPDGYSAEIKDGKVIIKKKESEDERIRKELLEEIEFIIPHDDETDSEGLILPSYHARINRYKSYLEKQKEKQHAEWSEEDEAAFGDLMWCIEQARKSAKDENDMGNIWFAENWAKNRLKSIRPQPHWKPSEEQISALERAIVKMHTSNDVGILAELRDNLKKL